MQYINFYLNNAIHLLDVIFDVLYNYMKSHLETISSKNNNNCFHFLNYRDFFGNLCMWSLIVLQKYCYDCKIVLDDDIKVKIFFFFISDKRVEEEPKNKYNRNKDKYKITNKDKTRSFPISRRKANKGER